MLLMCTSKRWQKFLTSSIEVKHNLCKFKFQEPTQHEGVVEGLTWDCSSEFDATSDQAIGFLHDDSFLSFPNWISRSGAVISFRVIIFLWAFVFS